VTAKKTTAKKTTAKKTPAKTGTAAAKATKKTAAKTTASAISADAGKASKEKHVLLDHLHELGLLRIDRTDVLAAKADDLAEAPAKDVVSRSAAWDKALASELLDFSAAGGDGKAGATHQALLVWQRALRECESDPRGILDALVALKKVVPYTGATIFLRDPEAGMVKPFVFSGFQVDLISRIRFAEGDGFSSWVASRKKPVLYSELHRNEAPRDDQVRSFMAVPMVIGGVCMGVLTLGHNTEGTFTPQSLRTAILAGDMLAGLLQKYQADAQITAKEIVNRITGIYSEGYLRNRIDEEVTRSRELGYSMTLLSLQLNELSEYTDRFGPEYKERVWADLGELLQGWRTGPELVGHGPDDKVFVIIPGTPQERSEARAAELTELLEGHSFPRRKRMTVTLSMAGYPTDAEDAQDLLDVADKALNESCRARNGQAESVSAVAA